MSGVGRVGTYPILGPGATPASTPVRDPTTTPVGPRPVGPSGGILPNAPDALTISSAAPPLSAGLLAQLLDARAEQTTGSTADDSGADAGSAGTQGATGAAAVFSGSSGLLDLLTD